MFRWRAYLTIRGAAIETDHIPQPDIGCGGRFWKFTEASGRPG